VTRDGYKLGTVNVIDSKPREVAEQDLSTLSDLASVVLDEMELRLSATKTITLERERADAENREKNRLGRVAKTLQQILLPASLPEVPGAEIATFYRPGSTDDIGGDFYDVFPLTGNRWAATVGDVAGKGVEAAALTSLARYTMRGAAIQTHDPGDVLSAINETVALDQRNAVPPKHCTAVFAVCEIDSGGADITLANGGHPPAILLTAEGSADIVPAGGPILGWMPDAKYPTASVRLRPGDTLLLYTDGITDARNDGERFGEGAFVRALADRTDNAPKAVVAEIKSLLDKFDSPPSDDIAVLAIGVPTR
jgi:sigma-B regulation protein RsbU (phosphoserine phosphatase)